MHKVDDVAELNRLIDKYGSASMIENLLRLEKAEQEVAWLQDEVMAGHRAFEELFGESFRGRTFATKLSMAKSELAIKTV